MSSFFANLMLLAYVEGVSALTHIVERRIEEKEMAAWRDGFVITVRDIVDASFWAELRAWNVRIDHMQFHDGQADIWVEIDSLPSAKKIEFIENIHALDSVIIVGEA